MLRERNMAVVYADSDEFPCIDEQTADFTYARLQRSQDDVETGYDANALDGWAKQARVWAKGNRDVYIFFISGAKVRNRSEERRVGKEWGSTSRSRWSPSHEKKTRNKNNTNN